MMNDTSAVHPASSGSSSPKQRIVYACEACRVSKAKCEPSSTEGICQRCSTSKRECIFRTGIRKRRRRSKIHPAATRSTPPPCAPSKTFTIHVPMQSDGDPDVDPLDNLRELHKAAIESLVSDSEDANDWGIAASSPRATSESASSSSAYMFSSAGSSRSTHSFRNIQPQFNLDSATSLLGYFLEDMLPYFPIIILPSNVSVASLANERPFVLLAILAAASGVRSLQGHCLYDEEFRKVLGLKFVGGGERSVELLVGLSIYCAWYPYHLRPKNKQAQQYIRMVVDIVRDLELDEPPSANIDITQLRQDEGQLSSIRAYLACYYLSTVFSSTFRLKHTLPHQEWTETCCSVLEHEGVEADRTLAWLVRLGYVVGETAFVNFRHKNGVQHDPQHLQLMYKGLEAQLRELQSQIPADIAAKPVLRMSSLGTEILLHGQPLLKFPSKTEKSHSETESHIDAERLLRCVNGLRLWFDTVLSLAPSGLVCFSSIEWSYLVITVILGLKLSFPLPHDCPSWDDAAARKILDLESFFERFSNVDIDDVQSLRSAASGNSERKRSSSDVFSASKVVVGMVQRRYQRRMAALEKAAVCSHYPSHPAMQTMTFDTASNGLRNCPMFDGSMDSYLEKWDDTFVNTLDFVNPALMTNATVRPPISDGTETSVRPGIQQTVFHDLWATMTMGWGQNHT